MNIAEALNTLSADLNDKIRAERRNTIRESIALHDKIDALQSSHKREIDYLKEVIQNLEDRIFGEIDKVKFEKKDAVETAQDPALKMLKKYLYANIFHDYTNHKIQLYAYVINKNVSTVKLIISSDMQPIQRTLVSNRIIEHFTFFQQKNSQRAREVYSDIVFIFKMDDLKLHAFDNLDKFLKYMR